MELPVAIGGIELDSETAARSKARRLRRLNTVTIPAMRFVGFSALAGGIYLYLRFFEHQADAHRVALIFAGWSLSYCVVAALVLRAFYHRLPGMNLPVVFLAADVLVQTVAIYLTGAEDSWLVALLLLRMADQATSGERRALFFTHWNVLCFLGMTVYLDLGEGRALDWPRELTKAGLLYAAGWWVSLSARGGDRRRRRVSAAIDATRRMIRRLKTQACRLDEAKAQAEAASEAKSQFLANMSHELRTPLSGVVGIAELLARDGLSAEQRRLVALLQTSGDAVLRIVDDVLDFAKIEAGKLSLVTEPCSLVRVVEDVLRLVDHQAREQRVTLRHTIPGDLPPVVADPARLRQILLNLVANAVKFSAEGSVEVRLGSLRKGGDRFRVRLEVADTGIGISDADQRRLFEPFTQADSSSSRRYGGTGLGLAIARQLLGLMDGEIGVSSRLGEGSVFWIELPLRLAAENELSESTMAALADALPESSCSRVLLVEDNPVSQVVAAGALRHLGAEVEVANNGREALAATAQGTFDLILMDCQMPEMDGLEATREIRRREHESGKRRSVIVALTAHALAEDRRQCLAAGMDDFLTKPVRRETLASVLAACTGDAAPQQHCE